MKKILWAILLIPGFAIAQITESNGICAAPTTGGSLEWGCAYIPDVIPEPEPEPEPEPTGGFELSNLVAAEFLRSNLDTSGVVIMPDDSYIITTQRSLQRISESGQIIQSNSSGSNDVEGLDYDGTLIAANESPGQLITYEGISATGSSSLPFSNIECVARSGGNTYYGIEHAGTLRDKSGNIIMNVGSNFAGCTFHDGWFLALRSKRSSFSVVYRIDPETWSIVESMSLPDGNWEGIDCNESKCVIVREQSSGGIASGIQVYRY